MKYALKLMLVSGLALGLGGCHRHESSATPVSDDGKASEPMNLRIYDVPPAQTDALAQSLAMALSPGGRAAVTTPAPGKLLIYAPEAAQNSIAGALSSLADSKKDASAPSSLNLRFWIVDALQGDGADDATLNTLGDVLKAWRTSMGQAHFKLVEATAASVREGGQGEIVTDYRFAYNTSAPASGDIAIQLDIHNMQTTSHAQGLTQFQGQLTITPGQFVVLAQTPAAIGEAPAGSDVPMARLLVMRVDRTQQR
jgi:hypothetical protein